MAIPYLEHFLDSLEPLPADLQRNFTLMLDLDKRTQDGVKKANELADAYLVNAVKLSPKDKSQRFKEIQDLFDKAKDFSDDKVQLAMQTYEMVDKHIRRLDSELAKLEAEMKEKQISGGNGGHAEEGKKKSRGRDKKGSSFNPKNVIKEDPEANKGLELGLPPLATSGTEVLDMPVDPNEPTYCICHQVSYGEMIGCDNADCPIEWFHFGCVGLTSKPKGKWFCPKCTSERKKK